MLRIYFQENENTVHLVDELFKELFRPEWLEDPLVVEMIEQIGKDKVLGPYCIQSPVFGQIAPTMISGSVKALILMLKTDYEIWATACGDDCAPYIWRIAEEREKMGKDLTICLEHYMDFGTMDAYMDTGEDWEFFCIDTGKVEQYEHYMDEVLGW